MPSSAGCGPRHDVRASVSGSKTFRIPEVGDIVRDWDTCPLPGKPGPVMLAFTVEPGSPDADRLQLLASLHGTRSARADKHSFWAMRRYPESEVPPLEAIGTTPPAFTPPPGSKGSG
ncbi:hypothetical protein [Streptomyces sp. NPDC046862]|uniref:MmyB family transcriptional regulator n=1 Tax=Streptomyces sp. NPDC046862 TaxID=3154603 RepID=UPI00345659DD